eukprot:TRINITY_DN13635_c0_g1_i1.p1 TRINITY_DN13635_c0_g1~~TRINITY_DN13635_c0_g1_i1.p1  ORF type:complete len:328 (+),score=22.51 TRINITY_DN13635_c0_g1_i1:784-1767(+)
MQPGRQEDLKMKTLRIAETDFDNIKLSREELEKVAKVLPKAVEQLLDGEIENVVGVGRGHKWVNGEALPEACIHVQVLKKVSLDLLPVGHHIPSEIDGVKTDVIEVGEIKNEVLTERVRPLRIGYSIGVDNIHYGTLGAFVVDGNGNYFVLSNNHVLSRYGQIPIGANVFQPSKADDGDDGDIFGELGRVVALNLIGNNYVDAALATVAKSENIPSLRPYVAQLANIELGMEVEKKGRTTELTGGRVVGDQVTALQPGGYKMVDQVTASYISDSGDSGSLVVSSQNSKVIGLHWGASTAGLRYLCKMEHVLTALNVNLYQVYMMPVA